VRAGASCSHAGDSDLSVKHMWCCPPGRSARILHPIVVDTTFQKNAGRPCCALLSFCQQVSLCEYEAPEELKASRGTCLAAAARFRKEYARCMGPATPADQQSPASASTSAARPRISKPVGYLETQLAALSVLSFWLSSKPCLRYFRLRQAVVRRNPW
jgi:hypothetical protein